MNWYFVPCNKHSVRRHKKTGVNDGILLSAAAATAPRHKPLRHAAATAATAAVAAVTAAWHSGLHWGAVAAAAAEAVAQSSSLLLW